jgi:hypothetical protein
MWFLNNTPMHRIGALTDHLLTYRLARFLPSKIYASLAKHSASLDENASHSH